MPLVKNPFAIPMSTPVTASLGSIAKGILPKVTKGLGILGLGALGSWGISHLKPSPSTQALSQQTIQPAPTISQREPFAEMNPYLQKHHMFMQAVSEELSNWIKETNPSAKSIKMAFEVLAPMINYSAALTQMSNKESALDPQRIKALATLSGTTLSGPARKAIDMAILKEVSPLIGIHPDDIVNYQQLLEGEE